MDKSTHKAEVIKVKEILQHPNADSLQIVRVDFYECIVRMDEFKIGDLAVYICPDSTVDVTRPEFSFLADPNHPEKKIVRVKAKKLRGKYSQGLLIKAPDSVSEGDDLAEYFGVGHWDPPEDPVTNADSASPPKFKDASKAPIYDVDSGLRYGDCISEGEECWVTEKIHGANSRFVFSSESQELHIGTHYRFVKNDGLNVWSKAGQQNLWLEKWCRENIDVIVYAEIFGQVQDLKYGSKPGQLFIRVFDLMKNGRYLDVEEAQILGKDLLWVPLVYRGPYNILKMKELSVGKSLVFGAEEQLREGIVVRPIKERWCAKMQSRLIIKFVSPEYLSRIK